MWNDARRRNKGRVALFPVWTLNGRLSMVCPRSLTLAGNVKVAFHRIAGVLYAPDRGEPRHYPVAFRSQA